MRRVPPALLLILLLAAPLAAATQVYTWTDASGTEHYADTPPPQGTAYRTVKSLPGAHHDAAPPAGAPALATSAARPAAAAASARIADTPQNRSRLCVDLGANIALLEGDQPLTVDDEHGQRQAMADERRRQELATAQDQRKQYCR